MPNQQKQHNGESPDPQARGGRRSQKPRQISEASLKNLKSWVPGQSGNPCGRPKSLVEISRLARTYCPEAVERLRTIMLNDAAPFRDQIQAAIALLDRGLGKPIVPVFKGDNGLPVEMYESADGDGGGSTLLRAAGQDTGAAYRQARQAELQRLDDEEQEEKAARRDETDAAREAMARGEEVSPLMRMLVEVRDSTE